LRHFAPHSIKTVLIILFLYIGIRPAHAQLQGEKPDVRVQRIEEIKLEIEKADSDSLRLPLRTELAGKLSYFDGNIAKEIFLDVQKNIKDKGYTSDHYQKLEAELLYSLSSVSLNLQDTAGALQYANEALAIATEIEYDMIIGRSISNLGNIYSRQMDFEKAKQFHKRALAIQKKANSTYGQALTLNRIGRVFSRQKMMDSAAYYYKKAIDVDTSKTLRLQIKGNLAGIYAKAEKYDLAASIYLENLKLLDPTAYNVRAQNHLSLARVYDAFKEHSKANAHVDSAIVFAEKINALYLIQAAHHAKVGIAHNDKKFTESYEAFLIQDRYKDSIVQEDTTKRFADLEFSYRYKNEKELAANQLENETSKKRLYFILLFVVVVLALLSIYFILRGKKQKIALAKNAVKLKDMERMKSDLALANRENELKKVVIENSITEEVLNKTLDDIKEIVTFQDENERKKSLRSLSLSLISEKNRHGSTSSLQLYLDKVEMEFKIHLDQNFQQFSSKEKELVYLLKLGLTSNEISKVLNSSIESVKSTRYRIRKKLGIDPTTDIIEYIEKEA
jgi:DNA-binding CsgD family transcriptional regulator/tetratricopeptide (TPR) repeat protein